jgi:hypothetical protein
MSRDNQGVWRFVKATQSWALTACKSGEYSSTDEHTEAKPAQANVCDTENEEIVVCSGMSVLTPVGYTVGAVVGRGVGAALQKPMAPTRSLGYFDVVRQGGKQVNLLELRSIVASFGKSQRDEGKEPVKLL